MRGWTLVWALANALTVSHAFQHSGLQLRSLPGRFSQASQAFNGRIRVGGAIMPGRINMSGFGFAKKDTFKYTGTQRLSVWPSKLKEVPESVVKPEYASRKDGRPAETAYKMPWDIHVNSPEEIAGIRQGL